MGNELQRVQAGDKFRPSADFHNAAVETIRGFREWITGAGTNRNLYNGLQVKLRNETGETLHQHDVVAVKTSLVLATKERFKHQIRVTGEAPTCDDWGRIAICRHPIKAGKIGLASMSGLAVARVNMHHAGDEWAELTPGDPSALDSQTGGGSARIKWVAPGLGVRLAIVELGEAHPGFGVEYAEDCPGRSQQFRVWVGRWDSDAQGWDYDRTTEFWAIDHRWFDPDLYGDLYPAKCATGLAKWKPSKEHGRIAEIWVADCSSPGCYGYAP